MKNDSVVAIFGLKRKKAARCLKKKQTAGGERRRTSCGLRVNLGESRLLINRHLLEMGIKKQGPPKRKRILQIGGPIRYRLRILPQARTG